MRDKFISTLISIGIAFPQSGFGQTKPNAGVAPLQNQICAGLTKSLFLTAQSWQKDCSEVIANSKLDPAAVKVCGDLKEETIGSRSAAVVECFKIIKHRSLSEADLKHCRLDDSNRDVLYCLVIRGEERDEPADTQEPIAPADREIVR